MEVTDKAALAEVEAKQKRISERLARKLKRNPIVGKFISFKKHIDDKKANIVISETKGKYGRAGNRIYKDDKLFKKFKNATKAKKFMGGME